MNERWLGTGCGVIVRWVRGIGLPVAVVPEAAKKIQATRAMLLPILPEDVRGRVAIRDGFLNADEAASFFWKARVVFGLEPHLLIRASTAGVPIVHARPLRNGNKGWVFADVGLGGRVFDIDVASPWGAETVLGVHRGHEAARRRAEEAREEVRVRRQRTPDVIAETLP